MTVGHKYGWPLIAVAYGFHALGLALDIGYHEAHPHAESAPVWAHLPIYVGAVVLLVGIRALARRRPDDPWLRVALVGTVVEVLALIWSVSVRAEANDFYVPAFVGVVGGIATFVALARTRLRERGFLRRSRPAH